MRLLHQEHKCPIYVIRRRYPETKNGPNSSFSNNFCHWNLNHKKTNLLCAYNYLLKKWVKSRCFIYLFIFCHFGTVFCHHVHDGV